MRGLYIHIPFCKNICTYCDFTKRILKNKEQEDLYINRLIEEIASYKQYHNTITTIYIGGGTPNHLSNENLNKLLSYINSLNLNILEYSIELNPELITLEQINMFNKYKINRVSIGAQSFIDEDLIQLGRKHTKQNIYNSVKLLKDNNITNINIDLIFSHPTDTLDKIKYNLECIKQLNIPHISYYSLILEEKTILYQNYLADKLKLVEDDLTANYYEFIRKELFKQGFKHYEISNYSKNKESIHNLYYWSNVDYIGVGLGASGYLNKTRYTNHVIIESYYNEYIEHSNNLDTLELKQDYLIMGLRKLVGINLKEYNKLFNSNIKDDFNLDKLIENKLIILTKKSIRLSKKGLLLSNIVFETFI
ncbi:MAG: radical SAM family heme chaperone HemW [Anaeroplasmataceae bacterium]